MRSLRAEARHSGLMAAICVLLSAGFTFAQAPVRPAGARDLLVNLDVRQQQVAGAWKFAAGVLESPLGERQRIEFPGEVPEEYQLGFDVERKEGQDAFCIGLVVAGKQTSILIDGYGGKASGLHLLDGQGCDRNATSYKKPILPTGKQAHLRVTVRRQEVSLASDGTQVFAWRGEAKQLSLFDGWKVKAPFSLFLGAHHSVMRVHAAWISPLTPDAAAVASAPPKAATPPAKQPAPSIAVAPAAAPPDAASPKPAAEKKPPPQTGAFELARGGVSTELYVHVMQRSGKPAYLPDIQRLQAKLEESRRAEKLKAKSAKKEEPDAAAPGKAEKADTKWSVYVPKDYDGVVPFGAIAFINSGQNASVHGDYKPILDKHRLIWISPSGAGNEEDTCWRMTAALDGLRRLREDLGYAIDPDRVYVSGISGGGRVASNVALLHPDVVTGGIYFAGVNYFRDSAAPGGGFVPAFIQGMTPALLAMTRQRRHVLIFGAKDNVAGYVPGVAPMFVKDGFKYFQYVEIPDLAHALPGADWFDKAVQSLDAPLTAAAKGHFDAAAAAEGREAFGKALQGYSKAAAHGGAEPFAAQAKQKAVALQTKYAAAVAALEEVLAAGDIKTITAELTKFRRVWEPVGAEDAKRLADEHKASQLKKKN